jgi:predicted enzyme involved in methoxymalonyl-ACP biosynthesis
MLDELVRQCKLRGVTVIHGYYYPSAKNAMVRDFFGRMGFALINEDSDGSREYSLDITDCYDNKNRYIEVKNG